MQKFFGMKHHDVYNGVSNGLAYHTYRERQNKYGKCSTVNLGHGCSLS